MTSPIIDSLNVWWEVHIAGVLSIDRGGAMHFADTAAWLGDPAAPILSQAMPKHAEHFDYFCKAIFGGVLPEEAQPTAIARALGIA